MSTPTSSPYKSTGGAKRIVRAIKYSYQGLAAAWRFEAAFRQECVLACVLLPSSFWLGRNLTEVFLLCAVVVVVLILELINSALEALADTISSEHHPLLGRAKDLGSAAVFLGMLLLITWWGGVAIDRFLLS